MERNENDSQVDPPSHTLTHTLGRRRFILKSCFALAGALLWNRTLAGETSTGIYIVKPGDTLSEIALRHGLSVQQLKAYNHLSGDKILVKQELRLVSGKDSFTRLKPIFAKIDGPSVRSGRWKHIILHHSGTFEGNAAIFHRYHLQERHMENGLAYHFVIGNGKDSRNGQVEVGGRWKKQLDGGHVSSLAYNANSIGICLVGNFQVRKPSNMQLESARQLITYLSSHLLDREPEFLVHKELEQTLCPGRHFPVSDFHRQFG